MEALGCRHEREPEPRAKRRRKLDRSSLHHRAHVLHVVSALGLDGRPHAGSRPAQGRGEDRRPGQEAVMTHGRAVIRVNPSGGITSSNSRCTRRHLVSMLLAAGGIATGCRRQTTDLGSRCDAALISALRALIAAQSPDGSWRSQTYGAFKDGLALTPLVLKTLVFGPPIAASETARMSGASFLSNLVRPDGSIDSGPYGLGFPVYTSAGAAIVLSRINGAGNRTACDAWLEQLRSRQLTEELGWSPADLAYGGWGDSLAPSVKLVPSEGPPARAPSADLSSTLFAIGALRLAGTGNDDVAVRKARSFVESCQNFADDDREADAAYDDGGFFFSPVELTRNKAGAAGSD